MILKSKTNDKIQKGKMAVASLWPTAIVTLLEQDMNSPFRSHPSVLRNS